MVEPASELPGSPDELGGARWRAELSYTHDYRWYAARAGLRTLECRIIRPYVPYEAFPRYHRNTVHYFYRGETARG